jgi:hypothetical protein
MSNTLPDSFGLFVNSPKRTQCLDVSSRGHDQSARKSQNPVKTSMSVAQGIINIHNQKTFF